MTISGGDGFFAVPDLQRPWLVYSASQGGNITLTDTRTGDQRSIHPDPNRVGSAGDALEHHKYRFNWNAPIALSPQNPGTVYFGGNVMFRSTNYGQSWDVISPDLSTNDKAKQKSSGGDIVTDNTAAEFHSTLLTIAPSPKDANVIWAGTDDGNVQVTRDGGKTWTNTTKNLPGLAPNAWISTVDASPHDAATAFVAASHWQTGDYTPYAYMTTDYGQTWRRITGNLPARGWVHVVRQDPRNPNLLFLGTEFGIFASWDRGARWHSLRNGMSAAPVRDLWVHPRDNDLIIATHGRGIYVLDDIAPLQKLAEAMAADAYVFDIRPATRWVMWANDGNLGQKVWVGDNPPNGAVIQYYLKAPSQQPVVATISDPAGKVVRTLRNWIARSRREPARLGPDVRPRHHRNRRRTSGGSRRRRWARWTWWWCAERRAGAVHGEGAAGGTRVHQAAHGRTRSARQRHHGRPGGAARSRPEPARPERARDQRHRPDRGPHRSAHVARRQHQEERT